MFPRFPFLVFGFPALLACSCFGEVVINEVQASNGSTIMDEDGDPSDWLELLNRGDTTVDLGGWGLTDTSDTPFKWVFPSYQLAPGARLVVWCSGKNRTDTTGGSPYGSPGQIPGLVLWLQAEAENHVDGESVTTWNDISGRGNHVTAPAADRKPVFRANRVNGRPAFQFTRSAAQEFRRSAPSFNGLDSLNDISLFMVAKWNGTTTPSGLLGVWDAASTPVPNSHFEINSGGSLRMRVFDLDTGSVPSTLAANEWAALSGTVAGGGDTPAGRLYKNGTLITSISQSPGDVLLADKEIFGIGASLRSGRNFDGDISEVLIYDRELAAAERSYVNIYLANRYALPGAQTSAEPELHANFSVSSEGEVLTLIRPDGDVEDLVAVGAMPQDSSYGRNPESGSAFGWFASPTPGTPNSGTSYGPPVAKPTLSEPRGFKNVPFNLSITHSDPAVTIRYTLDGSEPTATNGATYTVPISVSQTTVVRAAALKSGALPARAIATDSYLFLDDIISRAGAPPGYPSSWGAFTHTSYGVSPAIAAQPGYAEKMKAALAGFPTLSITIPVADMFGPSGIYSNPETRDIEKIASAEWISMDGVLDTQIDAGLRIQGGASRVLDNTPKKSLRLLFKGELGEGRLKVPVLAEGGTALADFNSIILRADYNNSWLHWDLTQRSRGTSLRDQWMRDSQTAMSGTGSHGCHVHLYINGIYWGVYNPSERPDAAFSASYAGGDRGDYDAMTHRGIRDGDNVAWNAMRAIAQAGLSTPAQYAAIRQYLDVPQFADYMILNIYGGNTDWPNNNWNATRRRETGAGYQFFAWDAERTLEGISQNVVSLTGSNNPAEFYAALRQNPEFRLLFADRVHRHFFNGGALTPEAAIARYSTRAARVESGVFAEQARWGAYRKEVYDRNGPSPVYALDPHWLAERDRLLNDYFPVRTANVLAQFKAANLYPNVVAPSFSPHGGLLAEEQAVSVTAPAGTIYYTLDGSDPRVPVTGAVAATAVSYTAPLEIAGSQTLKARVLSGGVWSALNEADFHTTLPEEEFLPEGSDDWTMGMNWSSGTYPDGVGAKALIHAPVVSDRNINLRVPVTAGSIRFDETSDAWRNRVRDQANGSTLTFDGGGDDALLRVDGDGTGYVEFDVAAGTILASDLEVMVNHMGGNADYGALRLRSPWSGPGGLRKTGPGVASLTGEGKNFTGPLSVADGVLQLTAPSTPQLVSAISVSSGGQIRLISGSTNGVPVTYDFATSPTLAGQGRGPSIPDGAGFGKLGALRYHPGSGDNHAVIAASVALAAPAGIHVDGSSNRLELTAPIAPNDYALTKTGGGTLYLNADNSGFAGPVAVATGVLEIAGPLGSAVNLAGGTLLAGHGSTGPLSGAGTVFLDQHLIAVSSLDGNSLAATMSREGSPDYRHSASAENGVLVANAIPGPLGACRVYLPAFGDVFRGVIFAPWNVDLAAVKNTAAFSIYQPDGAGGWLPVADAQVVTVPDSADIGSGWVAGRVIEVRLGAAPASFAAWQIANHPGVSDIGIIGPHACSGGDGISNLLRYALGIGAADHPQSRLPRFTLVSGSGVFRFPFDPGRDDIACIVEATDDLGDWVHADILFDSRIDFPVNVDNGWLTVSEPTVGRPRRFVRLHVILR